jgi:hypothetical protein
MQLRSRTVICRKREELAQAADPVVIVARVTQQAAELPPQDRPRSRPWPSTESIRELTYRGHHLRIRTTCHIEVDGLPSTATWA